MLPRKNVPAAAAALVLAAAVVVSATGGAVAGSLITGAQVKNGSLTGKDVKDGTLKTADLAPGVLVPGPAGPAGVPGPTGPTGPTGPSGTNTLHVVTRFSSVPAGTAGSVTATCPVGQKATGGVGWWFGTKLPAQFVITDGLEAGIASSDAVPDTDLLIARVICVPAANVVQDMPS